MLHFLDLFSSFLFSLVVDVKSGFIFSLGIISEWFSNFPPLKRFSNSSPSKRFTSYKWLRVWRRIPSYTHLHCQWYCGRLFPHSRVFSAIPVGLVSPLRFSNLNARIPKYQNTPKSWLDEIAKTLDIPCDLTNRLLGCIILTLAKMKNKKEV
jgi:hypothetical protein